MFKKAAVFENRRSFKQGECMVFYPLFFSVSKQPRSDEKSAMVLTLFLYRRCPLDFCFKLIRFAHTLTGSLKPSLELETHQQHRKT